MISIWQLDATRDVPVRGKDGHTLGNVEAVYLDADTGEPEWAVIKTGRFGHRRSFVPLKGATLEAGTLTVPYDEDAVLRSPAIEPGARLSTSEETELQAAYGMPHRKGIHTVPSYDVFPDEKIWT
jgi:hypothetical protein